MLGAVAGDIVGSRFEWGNIKTKEFLLFTRSCRPTDDSVMTLAVARALLDCRGDWRDLSARVVERMRELGNRYPKAGYGGRFTAWLRSPDPKPYGSFGNGSAMRVSPCAWAAGSLEEVKALSRAVTEVTHDHPEGIKGAEAAAVAGWMALRGCSMEEIRQKITGEYYPLDFTLDEIRPTYQFDVTCQGSVPQALESFFESVSFEDALRNAVSIGGDSDTIAAIAGGIAEAYYGIPVEIRERARGYLKPDLRKILDDFEKAYGRKTAPARQG